MAKKIRLDFSKVEERSGINTKRMPEGLHAFKITGVDDREASDGTDMYVFYLVPENAKYKTRRFPYYCKLQANQYWKLRELMVAAGVLTESQAKGKAVNIDPNKAVGKLVAGEVEDETGQYEGRSTIASIYAMNILDEDGSHAEDDDEDEEEYDEEEVDDSEDDEEYEDDEEEDEEDLSALSIAELRKRAKDLGYDTAGVKKADLIDLILEGEPEDEDEDDEDDLDEEELAEEEEFDEDEEDDEEEEEPAPAPKRRAPAKAPAKKAAPAATPARRVRRR